MKSCARCGGNGPFGKDKRLKSGLASRCLKCLTALRQAWANRPKAPSVTKQCCTRCGKDGPFYKDKYRKNGLTSWCKECVDSKVNAWVDANRAKKSRRQQVRRYGLTLEEFDRLLSEQNGQCRICLNILDLAKATHIDHNHTTGVVRGILCHHCNRGLGLFKENEENLLRAINYLRGQI